MYLDVLVITRESFLGTEGAFLELLTNLLTQFFTPSKDVNSLRGRRDHGLELFMSSTETAIARPTLKQINKQIKHLFKYYLYIYTYMQYVHQNLMLRPLGLPMQLQLFYW